MDNGMTKLFDERRTQSGKGFVDVRLIKAADADYSIPILHERVSSYILEEFVFDRWTVLDVWAKDSSLIRQAVTAADALWEQAAELWRDVDERMLRLAAEEEQF